MEEFNLHLHKYLLHKANVIFMKHSDMSGENFKLSSLKPNKSKILNMQGGHQLP